MVDDLTWEYCHVKLQKNQPSLTSFSPFSPGSIFLTSQAQFSILEYYFFSSANELNLFSIHHQCLIIVQCIEGSG